MNFVSAGEMAMWVKSAMTLGAFVLILALGLALRAHADASGSWGSGSSRLDRAVQAIDEGKYKRAVSHLNKHLKKNPEDADGLNYMGYSLRKLGRFEASEEYYLKALEIDPEHLGANEYLGELYVQTDRMNLAKQRLETLAGACGDCEEYAELKEAIEAAQ